MAIKNEVIIAKIFHKFIQGLEDMEIKINFPENNSHVSNLAFIKAIMIKKTIEDLNISYEEKQRLRKEVLEHFKNT